MNTAILLSGGVGSRLCSEIPKQYLQAGDRMLITYAVEVIAKAPCIDKLLIVAERKWQDIILEDVGKIGVQTDKIIGFAAPGFNRQASVLNGMQELLRRTAPELLRGLPGKGEEVINISDADTVFIHDAARPLLSQKQIQDCFDALMGHDGVMPVLPMKDTVYLSRDGATVSELLDRNQIFAGQAPELFRFKKYYRANMALTPEELAVVNGSTEPAILAGMDIVMVPGDERNFKITTPEDLERFLSLAARGETRKDTVLPGK